MPRITCLEVGQLGCCCYIVAPDGGESEGNGAVVIDPGDESGRIGAELRNQRLTLDTILLTHSHLDHIGAVDELLAAWPEATLACSAETSRRAGDPVLNLSAMIGFPVTAKPAGKILKDGDRFTAAGLNWRAVEIPGHDPGEMVYVLGEGDHVVPGDVLFAGSVGRSDFPGGDARALVRGVNALLSTLPPSAAIHPGHGPATTARTEQRSNPFLRG